MSLLLPALILAAVVLIISHVRIASEHQRFAVSAVGRFHGLRGPGLLFKWSGGEVHWERLQLGQLGTLLGDGRAQFGRAVVPITSGEPLSRAVKIERFESDVVVVVPAQLRIVPCEKCGHLNEVAA